MKKLYVFLALSLLCVSLAACAGAKRQSVLNDVSGDRGSAVIDVDETDRSKIDIPETTAVTTLPQYFEVVATGTTAATTKKEPAVTTPPKEIFTVKFVDTDGYTAISVQSVEEGGSAAEPPMPNKRGDLVFRGWDKDFTNIKSGTVVKAIYQKEWLTVRFYDADATLLKTTKVRYGEAANPPTVADKGDYLFDGWNAMFGSVTEDLDVYAVYAVREHSAVLTLTEAYSILGSEINTVGLPVAAYYRENYTNPVIVGKTEYSGNVIYGNFCDMITVADYGFKTLEGTLALDEETECVADSYKLIFYVYVDGEETYKTEITRLGSSRDFSVNIENASNVTLRLETLVDDFIYYGDVTFVGGLVNTAFYK